jgi:hypothetical protein
MYSGKSYVCHLYGIKNRKVCVLDIDMEMLSVILSNVQWKKLGCHLNGMKMSKACVLDIDMEMHL